MADSSTVCKSSEPTIDRIDITRDTLTGRGGLSLFVRYLRNIELYPHLQRLFGSMRRSSKGVTIESLFKQLFCFFLDGTSLHLVRFDTLKRDPGYTAAIETGPENMASSHAIKRFFGAFSWYRIWLFRPLLKQLFGWRLRVEQPEVIVLGIDTMPMDNGSAKKREGVEPTYKKGVKGFAPLHLTWGPYLIDAVLRGGSKHSNHGNTVANMVGHVVRFIRKHYRRDVPILLRLDAGFYDQKLFTLFEEMEISYICGGKLYPDIKAYLGAWDPEAWQRYENDHQVWEYVELADCRESWKRFRRAIFTTALSDERQLLLDFARPDNIIYTNLGRGETIDELLEKAGHSELTEATRIIEIYHDRGRDELVHRALKEFGGQTLPFHRFHMNAAFYATMLLTFFLYEAFKRDVCSEVIPVDCYPNTLRRMVIDIAAKIIRTGGEIILKVTKATWEALKVDDLWQLSGCPPAFTWVS